MSKEKLTDLLLAGCLGDAIGYSVEFKTWTQIQDEYGPEGITKLHESPFSGVRMPGLRKVDMFEASDDTQMTLFAIEGIINAFKSQDPVTEASVIQHTRWAFLDWNDTQNSAGFNAGNIVGEGIINNEVLWKRQAPGNTCLSALAEGADGTRYEPINNSKGCGTIMRTAPFAFLHEKFPTSMFALGADQGALTHGHIEGWTASGAFTAILAKQLQGKPLYEAVAEVADDLDGTSMKFTLAAKLMKMVLAAASDDTLTLHNDEMTQRFGLGWIAEECLAVAIYCALKNRNVTDTIIHSANHSGDSDSTASCAAQLAALEYGLTPDERSDAKLVDLAPLCVILADQLTDILSDQPPHSSH